MPVFFSLAVTLEIIFIIAAVFSEIRRHVHSEAEAYVYSSILSLSVFSVSIQFFFLLEIHRFYPAVDAALLLLSTCLLYRNRQILAESYGSLKLFCKQNPFFSFSLTFFSACLFIKGFLLPPTTVDSLTYHLARVLMMQNDGTYFLENFNDYRQDIMPIGYDVLHFLYLRFYTDYGLAAFGFLSYTVVLAGIFALSNACLSDIRFSKTACFIGASLTMFLVGATITKNDLVLAAIAVACFLSVYNYSKTRECLHLLILITALCFGLNAKFTFGAFFLPFLFFYTIFLFKKLGFKALHPVIAKDGYKWLPLFILPLCLVSLLINLFIHNSIKYGALMGPEFYLAGQTGEGGVLARSINIIRYFFQLMDLPPELGGHALTMLHDAILGQYRSIGLFPGVSSIQLAGRLFTDPEMHDVFAWYGFLGLPIVFSVLFTMVAGRNFLRSLAATILVYAVIIIFTMPWAPWNGRFFAPLFAGGVICSGFMLKQVSDKSPHASKWLTRGALLIAAANLLFQVGYVNISQMPWLKLQFENRDIVYSKPFPPTGWDFFINKIPPDSKVLLIIETNAAIFPLLLRRPDLNLTLTGMSYAEGKFIDGVYRETFKLNGKSYDMHHIRPEEFKTIEKYYDKILFIGVPKTP